MNIIEGMAVIGSFKEAKQLVHVLKYDKEIRKAQYIIAVEMTKAGLYKEALMTIGDIHYADLSESALKLLTSAVLQSSLNDTDKADLLDSVIESAMTVFGPGSQVLALFFIATKMDKAAFDKNKIHETFEKAIRAAKKSQYRIRKPAITICDIAEAMFKSGLEKTAVDRAFAAALEATSKIVNVEKCFSLSYISQKMIECERPAEAINVIESLVTISQFDPDEGYDWVFRACRSHCDKAIDTFFSKAIEHGYFQEALLATKKFKNNDPKSLMTIASKMAEAGKNKEKVQAIFILALVATKTIDKDDQKSCVTAISEAMLKTGIEKKEIELLINRYDIIKNEKRHSGSACGI